MTTFEVHQKEQLRIEFTKAAMQGLCADSDVVDYESIARGAVAIAEATLAHLEKTSTVDAVADDQAQAT